MLGCGVCDHFNTAPTCSNAAKNFSWFWALFFVVGILIVAIVCRKVYKKPSKKWKLSWDVHLYELELAGLAWWIGQYLNVMDESMKERLQNALEEVLVALHPPPPPPPSPEEEMEEEEEEEGEGEDDSEMDSPHIPEETLIKSDIEDTAEVLQSSSVELSEGRLKER